ncbi:aldehyde dehydrogenase family protein [Lentzea aerocolonigenes]|uniref:aldehyde dehydrogenase family protein n=1 Tax=Lentzea aerocolonigenes TaxID=68170 RepID=UPI0004C37AC6|nr:aldehyde dehydrogenase family protein [Lentzea aerocolonigenes]MCP2246482.1 aldehyde dehydrogenase [Lentzea aerocolonigenes]
MTQYAAPGRPGSVVAYRQRYDHFIGGDYVAPVSGEYAGNVTPVTGEVFTEVARGTDADRARALHAASGAARAWGSTTARERATVLCEIADRVEEHATELAVAETWDNGKPVREALVADVPLLIEQFRQFAAAIRTEVGQVEQVGRDTCDYRSYQPLGVVHERLSWTFPLLNAGRVLAPALAAGNAVVLEPALQTPASIHVLLGVIADLLPPGVVNVVTGSDDHPVVSARCPNIFFADVPAHRDNFLDKALEGFAMFAANQGEISTAPSRALIQTSIYEELLTLATERTRQLRLGDPLDTDTMVGAVVSLAQRDRVMAYVERGRAEGARLVTGGEADGHYVQPTIFEGDHRSAVFAADVLGPVVSVTRFDDRDDALKIANESTAQLGAGVWCRDVTLAHNVGQELRAERVWVNNYHAYPANTAALAEYRRPKHLLVSYSDRAQGYF